MPPSWFARPSPQVEERASKLENRSESSVGYRSDKGLGEAGHCGLTSLSASCMLSTQSGMALEASNLSDPVSSWLLALRARSGSDQTRLVVAVVMLVLQTSRDVSLQRV
eukprot:5196943-Amphidinium_carterae.1